MLWLLVGMVLFIGVHSVSIVAPDGRNAAAAKMGEGGWKGLYSLLSVLGVALIAIGYGAARADPVVLWTPPAWTRHLAMLLMLPVFVLFFAPYLPGRIKAAAKHPQLLAVKIWATAHLLANGTLADVVLFGGFLAWAVADRISLKRRPARPLPGKPPSAANDLIAVVVGLVVYALLVFGGHRWLVGVPLLR